MGTTTVLDELQNLAQEHKPCIKVLTETKLTELEQDRKMLNNCLPELALVLGDFATPLPQKLLLIHITVNLHIY